MAAANTSIPVTLRRSPGLFRPGEPHKSALADCARNDPISGKPEIGGHGPGGAAREHAAILEPSSFEARAWRCKLQWSSCDARATSG